MTKEKEIKAPTENGYYWVRFTGCDEWEVIEIANGRVYRTSQAIIYYFDDIAEWGDKIEHRLPVKHTRREEEI